MSVSKNAQLIILIVAIIVGVLWMLAVTNPCSDKSGAAYDRCMVLVNS